MILDTTVIIDILRGNKLVLEKVKDLEDKSVVLSTTSISVFEIWQGIKETENEEKIQNFFESINVFMFDIQDAQEAGRIQARLKKQGLIIDPEDSMIAGIAKIHKESVLTKNIHHFERINNLKVESY